MTQCMHSLKNQIFLLINCFLCSLFSIIAILYKVDAMDHGTEAAADRILLEPYKYLLQLPGESLCLSVTQGQERDVDKQAAVMS